MVDALFCCSLYFKLNSFSFEFCALSISSLTHHRIIVSASYQNPIDIKTVRERVREKRGIIIRVSFALQCTNQPTSSHNHHLSSLVVYSCSVSHPFCWVWCDIRLSLSLSCFIVHLSALFFVACYCCCDAETAVAAATATVLEVRLDMETNNHEWKCARKRWTTMSR